MTHYVYTKRDSGFLAGCQYRNPRFFERPYPDATKVEVEGDYPHIVEAYKAAGVEVVGGKSNTHGNAHLKADHPKRDGPPDDGDDKQALLDELAERGIHKDMRSSKETLKRLLAETEESNDDD